MQRTMMLVGLVVVIGCGGPKLPTAKMVESRMRDALLIDPRHTVLEVTQFNHAIDDKEMFFLRVRSQDLRWELKFAPNSKHNEVYATAWKNGDDVFGCSFFSKDLTLNSLQEYRPALPQAEQNAMVLEARRLMRLFQEACRP